VYDSVRWIVNDVERSGRGVHKNTIPALVLKDRGVQRRAWIRNIGGQTQIRIFFFSRALAALTGPWSLLQFRNHFFYTDGRTPWTSDQPVARSLPIHRTTQTLNKRIHRHPCLEWD
jgi:hypothetical protein